MGNMSTSPWADLIAEADAPPIWSSRILLGTDPKVYLLSQAWRTRRMDILLQVHHSGGAGMEGPWDDMMQGITREVLNALEWIKETRLSTTLTANGKIVSRKIIIQVEDGHQLEPVINLIARFEERWS